MAAEHRGRGVGRAVLVAVEDAARRLGATSMELNVFGFIVAVIAAVALLAMAERTGIGAGDERRRLTH